MKFRFSQSIAEPQGPNLTPLIDVVFLLLIFFMVSSTFLEESAIEIQLPEANGLAPDTEPDVLQVHINARGCTRLMANPSLPGIVAPRCCLGASIKPRN